MISVDSAQFQAVPNVAISFRMVTTAILALERRSMCRWRSAALARVNGNCGPESRGKVAEVNPCRRQRAAFIRGRVGSQVAVSEVNQCQHGRRRGRFGRLRQFPIVLEEIDDVVPGRKRHQPLLQSHEDVGDLLGLFLGLGLGNLARD